VRHHTQPCRIWSESMESTMSPTGIYAMVAIIELARVRGDNPTVPKWLEDDYFSAIQE